MKEEILKRFCSNNEDRLNINRPWSIGEYTCATNGHCIVRVPRMAVIEEREGPNLGKLFPYDDPPEWFAISDIKLPEVQKADCSTCQGDGTIEHDDCPDCGGHDCVDCGGTGKVASIQPIPVGNSYFQLIYLSMLKDLPNCKIGPAKEPLDPAPFQFDGGDGLIMPMRKDQTWRY